MKGGYTRMNSAEGNDGPNSGTASAAIVHGIRTRLAGGRDRLPSLPGPAGTVGLSAVVVAALLRLYQLGAESVWLDEAFTWAYVTQTYRFWELVFVLPMEDVHPPLYYLVVDVWVALAGTSEVALRVPSVVFGVVSVALIYLVGKRLFDRWTGAAAAALLSVSSFHVYYSQEARMYSLFGALTLASFYFFIDVVGDRQRPRTALLGYVVASTLLVYTHLYGLFVVLAQQAYVLLLFVLSVRDWPLLGDISGPSVSGREWSATTGLLGVLSAPWLLVLFDRLPHIAKGGCSSIGWIPAPCIQSLTGLVSNYCFYCGTPEFFPQVFSGNPVSSLFFPLVLAGVVGLATLGFFGRARTVVGRPGRHQVMLLLWLLVPVVVPFVISVAVTPILVPRYTIPASLALFLLVGKGLRTVPVPWTVVVAGIVLVGLTAPLAPYYGTTQKQPWDDVAPNVESAADEEALVVVSQSQFVRPYQYYAGRPAETIAGINDDATHSEVRRTVRDYEDVWLVVSRARYEPLAAHLQSMGYVLRSADTSRDIRVFHFHWEEGSLLSTDPPPTAMYSTATDRSSRPNTAAVGTRRRPLSSTVGRPRLAG